MGLDVKDLLFVIEEPSVHIPDIIWGKGAEKDINIKAY